MTSLHSIVAEEWIDCPLELIHEEIMPFVSPDICFTHALITPFHVTHGMNFKCTTECIAFGIEGNDQLVTLPGYWKPEYVALIPNVFAVLTRSYDGSVTWLSIVDLTYYEVTSYEYLWPVEQHFVREGARTIQVVSDHPNDARFLTIEIKYEPKPARYCNLL